MLWKSKAILASVYNLVILLVVDTSAVTFTTRMIYGSSVDDGNNNIYTWAVETPLVSVRIQSSDFEVPSGSAFPRLILTLDDGTQAIICAVEVDASGCTSCSTYPVICTKEVGSAPLILEFNTTRLTPSYNQSKLVLTELSGIVSDWNYGTKTISLENCDNNAFGPDANAQQPALLCGYQCTKTFDCSLCTDITFDAQCQASVNWGTASTTCPGGCSINAFASRAAPDVGIAGVIQACGNDLRFKCNSSLVCHDTFFTPFCQLNANWNFTNIDKICHKFCERLTDAHISAIVLGILCVVLDLIGAFFVVTRSDEDYVCSLDWLTGIIKNLSCCKYWTAYCILGLSISFVFDFVGIIVIVTSTPEACCGLDGQAIGGIVTTVLGNAVIVFFWCFSSECCVKKTAKISPHPANSNSEQPEETVELNATSGSQP